MKKNNTLKRILTYNGVVVLTFLLLYFSHQALLNSVNWKIPFSLFSIYLFFAIASLIIITGIELLFDFMPANAGYAFLVGIFLKMGAFILIFFSKGLGEATMNFTEKIAILVPLFVFLIIETIAIATRLKQTDNSQI